MSEGSEPTLDDMREGAVPATYRRAPRTERFILTGVAIGAGAGFLLGVILPAGNGTGRGVAGLLLALAGALAGGLITGAQAALLEYTSGRSMDRQRRDLEGQWAPGTVVFPKADLARWDMGVTGAAASTSPAADADEGDGSGAR